MLGEEPETGTVLPWGKFAGRPVDRVPTNYLRWVLTRRVAYGLRMKVMAELARRGDAPGDLPPAAKPREPQCSHCGGRELRLSWVTRDGDPRGAILCECTACQRRGRFAPKTEANCRAADASARDEASAWVGWFRRHAGEPWQRVCEGDDFEGCWVRLLEYAGPPGDRVALAAGRAPGKVQPGTTAARHRLDEQPLLPFPEARADAPRGA